MTGRAPDLEARRRQLLALRDQLVADDAVAKEMRAPVTLDQESVGRLSRIDAMEVQAVALAAQRHR
jgi:DnaK suppressor protein